MCFCVPWEMVLQQYHIAENLQFHNKMNLHIEENIHEFITIFIFNEDSEH